MFAKRWKNILLWTTGVFLSIFIISGVLLVLYKDKIKDYAIEELNQYLNKKIHVGYIDLSFWQTFPNVSLDFENLLIHSQFGSFQTADTALFAEKIRLRFDAWDIINGNYSLERVDIINGKFNMVTRADGSINYDFLKPTDSVDSSSSEFSIDLEKIYIENTDYQYIHQKSGQRYSTNINKMNLAGNLTSNQFLLSSDAEIWIKSIQNKSLTILSNKRAKLFIEIEMDNEKDLFEIKHADLSINTLPFSLNGKMDKTDYNFTINSKGLLLEDFVRNFSIQELSIIEKINGKGAVDITLDISGKSESDLGIAINSNFIIKNGSLSDGEISLEDIELNGHYTNGILSPKEQLSISSISFSSSGSQFSGNLNLEDFERPHVKGRAKGNINLAAIHRIFGPKELTKLDGNIMVNGNFDLRLNQPKYDLKNISVYNVSSNLELYDIRFKTRDLPSEVYIPSGALVVQNQRAISKNLLIHYLNSDLRIDGSFEQITDYFKGDKSLVVDAMIESNLLNLDEFSTQEDNNTRALRKWIFPNDISGKMTISMKNITYSNHQYTSVKSRVNYANRTILFEQLNGENAGARISGTLKLTELRPMELTLNTNLDAKNIPIKRLFKEWNNFDQEVISHNNIDGNASIALSFKGLFDLYNGELQKKTVLSDATILLENGRLVGVPTFAEITSSLKEVGASRLLISKQKIEDFEKELMDLRIASLTNTIRIENGVINIPKMIIITNALDLNLSGTHTFDNDINYSFNFRFRDIKGKNITTEFGDVIDDETGFRVFLKMDGNIENPNLSWDREARKEMRKIQKEETKEEIKSVLKTGFGINKKDTTINISKEDVTPKEIIELKFNQIDKENEELEKEKTKKKTKLQLKLEEWKKENEQNNEQFEIDR